MDMGIVVATRCIMSIIEKIIKNFDMQRKVNTLNFFEDYLKTKIDHIRRAHNIDTPRSVFDIKPDDIKKIIVEGEEILTVQLHQKFDEEEIYWLKMHLEECFGTYQILIHSDDFEFK
jgi:transcriptional regulatory protein LevR